jgi:hypothetical protein
MTTTEQALAKIDTDFDTVVANILAVFDRATPANIEAGAAWYPTQGQTVIDYAHSFGYSVDTVAAVVAHLSPRTPWDRNITQAAVVLAHGETVGVLGMNLRNAQKAMASDAPLDTLKGNKVKAFAANLLGDTEAVTVDVWAIRVALGHGDGTEVSKVGVYDAIASAYREAARLRGVEPSTMQAVTWVVARNGRAG